MKTKKEKQNLSYGLPKLKILLNVMQIRQNTLQHIFQNSVNSRCVTIIPANENHQIESSETLTNTSYEKINSIISKTKSQTAFKQELIRFCLYIEKQTAFTV
jgi:hypothetical protein